jgi:hypothetical protein
VSVPRTSLLLTCLLLAAAGGLAPAEQPDAAGRQTGPAYGTPEKTFAAFARAVKSKDLAGAKDCWSISDDNRSGVLDLLVGEWVEARRLDELARSKFAAELASETEEPSATARAVLLDESCTDAAIDRTLERLRQADVEIRGDTAQLRIRWRREDTGENPPPFFYRCYLPYDARFRQVKGAWKLDAHWEIGLQRPADCLALAAHSAGPELALRKQLIADIESGKIQTAAQAVQALQEKRKALWARAKAEGPRRHTDPREARFFAAWSITDRWSKEYYCGRETMRGLCRWSRRLMEAERTRGGTEREGLAAAAAHLERMSNTQYSGRVRVVAGRAPVDTYLGGDNYRFEAEVLLARAKGGPAEKSIPREAAASYLASARLIYQDWLHMFEKDKMHQPLSVLTDWLSRLEEAEGVVQRDEAERRADAEEDLKRARKIEKLAREKVKGKKLEASVLPQVTFFRAAAEVRLAELESTGSKGALAGLARERLHSARTAYEGVWEAFLAGQMDVESVYDWSDRWRSAAAAVASSGAERVAAAAAHLQRMKKLQQPVWEQCKAGRRNGWESSATDYYVAEAEILLAAASKK